MAGATTSSKIRVTYGQKRQLARFESENIQIEAVVDMSLHGNTPESVAEEMQQRIDSMFDATAKARIENRKARGRQSQGKQ